LSSFFSRSFFPVQEERRIPSAFIFIQTDKEEKTMTVDRLVLMFAGVFILGSLALAQIHSPYWLLFTAFVGLNLFQSSFTGFCPLAKILGALGAKPGVIFKV
jgi:hypothetical protein